MLKSYLIAFIVRLLFMSAIPAVAQRLLKVNLTNASIAGVWAVT